jgi:hypothetical protein
MSLPQRSVLLQIARSGLRLIDLFRGSFRCPAASSRRHSLNNDCPELGCRLVATSALGPVKQIREALPTD